MISNVESACLCSKRPQMSLGSKLGARCFHSGVLNVMAPWWSSSLSLQPQPHPQSFRLRHPHSADTPIHLSKWGKACPSSGTSFLPFMPDVTYGGSSSFSIFYPCARHLSPGARGHPLSPLSKGCFPSERGPVSACPVSPHSPCGCWDWLQIKSLPLSLTASFGGLFRSCATGLSLVALPQAQKMDWDVRLPRQHLSETWALCAGPASL